jgi:endonuclease-8
MPEGHTLHRLATSLRDAFAGEVVSVSSPQGRFAESAALLDGTCLLGAESFGKHLFVEFDQARFVHVHLGLYGKFVVSPAPAPEPVGQVRLRLVGASSYADLRGATTCALVTPEHRDDVLARLGPDPLVPAADPDRAWQRIRTSRAPVGGLLMDQSVLAGVGNVYRAEVLFRHRMHPMRPGRTLRSGQWRAMWDDLVVLMADGVRSGRIETLRREDRELRPDESLRNYVYRRTGEPCLVCGARVRTAELQGRNLFWCPRCQPIFRSRAVR